MFIKDLFTNACLFHLSVWSLKKPFLFIKVRNFIIRTTSILSIYTRNDKYCVKSHLSIKSSHSWQMMDLTEHSDKNRFNDDKNFMWGNSVSKCNWSTIRIRMTYWGSRNIKPYMYTFYIYCLYLFHLPVPFKHPKFLPHSKITCL